MKKRSIFIIGLALILALGGLIGTRLMDGRLLEKDIVNTISKEEAIEVLKEEGPPEPVYVDIDILAVGDIMFHIPQIRSSYMGNGTYDFSPMFEYVKEYIEGADLSLANYETVTLNDIDY